MTKQVLLTVSGTIPADIREQIARGERPRADYLELAAGFDADLIDYARARQVSGRIGRLIERFAGSDFMLAYACFKLRRHYKAIFTDGEQIGLPLAAMLKLVSGRRPRHLMITHIISVPKKMLFLDRLGVQSHIDRFLVYANVQKRFIEARWKIPSERVLFTPFMVDQRFFAPDQVIPAPQPRPQICAVGLERRDYPTLLKAVEGLNAHVVIAAASPWSKRTDSTRDQVIPENVTVRKFTQHELRQLYADSSCLVMPLENVDFQAGVTAILEALSMERPVICSRTIGQTDIIGEGENGYYVPPGDPAALRATIEHLLANSAEAARLGKAGRFLVEQSMSLDRYVERLKRFVRDAIAEVEDAPQRGVSPVRFR